MRANRRGWPPYGGSGSVQKETNKFVSYSISLQFGSGQGEADAGTGIITGKKGKA